nr:putative TTHA0068-like domain protein [Ipomoea batatas]
MAMTTSTSFSQFNLISKLPHTSRLSTSPIGYPKHQWRRKKKRTAMVARHRFSSWRGGGGGGRFIEAEDDDDDDEARFEYAVALFNRMEYYKCHDVLEALWHSSDDPSRTLFHAILQCAVGFHHLFNQNHKGAMMELGEGLCKLRKMNFESGPFYQFEKEITAALDFVYQTQLELAACSEDLCLAMDQSEISYQLLGGYAAGQQLYILVRDDDGITYLVFCHDRYITAGQNPRIKIPILMASEEHLMELECI